MAAQVATSVARYLELESAALAQLEIVAGGPRLPLPAVFQPPRVLVVDPAAGRNGTTREWREIRSQIELPVLLAGEPGSGKSTLLAWEFCERARDVEAGASLPIRLRMMDLACLLDDAPERGSSRGDPALAVRVIARIARIVAERLSTEPAALLADLRRNVRAALQDGRATLLIDDFDPADHPDSAFRRAIFATNLRALLATHPGSGVLMASRFGPATLPHLRSIWQVCEILPWPAERGAAFVDRFAERQRSPFLVRERVRAALGATSSIQRLREQPRLLALLCVAASEDQPASGATGLVRRACELLIDAARTPFGPPRPADRARMMALAGILAVGMRRSGSDTFAAADVLARVRSSTAPSSAADRPLDDVAVLLRLGILRRETGASDRLAFAHPALTDALAAAVPAQ
jgi:hypothetical protein